MFDEPSYQKRIQERMAEDLERQRQEEIPAERSARTAYEKAQEHLETIKKSNQMDATGRSYNPYTWEDLRKAEDDLKEQQTNYFKVRNDAARDKRLKAEADKKKADADAQEAIQNKIKAENQTRLKESMWAAYPGTAEQFAADWPELRRQNYIRATLDADQRARDSQAAMFRGRF